MMLPPCPRRGESPPRSSWRSCLSASRPPGTPWFWRGNSPPGAATRISPGRAPAAPSGSRPAGITAPAPRRPGSSSSQSAPDALSPTRVPNRSPSGSSGTPRGSRAWPGRTVNRTEWPVRPRPPRPCRPGHPGVPPHPQTPGSLSSGPPSAPAASYVQRIRNERRWWLWKNLARFHLLCRTCLLPSAVPELSL